MQRFFITAVGTGIGKTLVTTSLCQELTRLNRRVAALKPIVSGFSSEDADSDPALILRSLGRSPTPETIAAIAPWRLAAPLSPHLAAQREGRPIDLEKVVAFCREWERTNVEYLIVEGAGGVMSPIDSRNTCLELILRLDYPVILVTGTYLGAISHTLTALYALGGRGARLGRIVVSESADSAGLAETVERLIPHVESHVSLDPLPRLPGSHEEKWCAARAWIAAKGQPPARAWPASGRSGPAAPSAGRRTS
jgi:dethiobiotin synthetase